MRTQVTLTTTNKSVETSALLDSGAAETFIDYRFVTKHGLPLKKLPALIKVYNADGTTNEHGTIRHCVTTLIEVAGHRHHLHLLVTALGKENIILGLPWLRRTNAVIDFSKGTLSIDPTKVELSASEKLRAMWFPNQN